MRNEADIQEQIERLRTSLATLKVDSVQIRDDSASMEASLHRLQELLASRRDAYSARWERRNENRPAAEPPRDSE